MKLFLFLIKMKKLIDSNVELKFIYIKLVKECQLIIELSSNTLNSQFEISANGII